MNTVHATLQKEKYQVHLTSETDNTLVADEPIVMGGQDTGFNPKELLIASLAACTSITVKMYADHKKWELDEVKVDVTIERDDKANTTQIHRSISFIGNLDEAQLNRLLGVAKACPIHKILSNPVEITTEFAD